MIIKHTAILALLLVILTACTLESAPPATIVIPTLAQLPSLTPTNTLTVTPLPTNTPTATLTFTPTFTFTPSLTPTATATLTFTPSLTFTPTFTLTPSATFTPSRTPTATRTPTPRPTRTPLPSQTPVPPTITPTPDIPVITSFTSSQGNIVAGNTLVLNWTTTNADSARIDQLTPQGTLIQTYSIATNGQLPIVLQPTQGRIVIFRLVAIRGGREVSQQISVGITCAISWFFGDNNAPADAGCPQAVGANAPGAFQPFERGLMIYVTANGLNRIFGLQNDGARYIAYVNGWDGVTIVETPAPTNFFIPQQMFNWVYYSTNAPIGGWSQQLGWAVANIDTSNRTIQYEQNNGRFYIDAPLGAVYRFSGGDSGTWTRIR